MSMNTHLVTFAICEMGPMGPKAPDRVEARRLPVGVVFNVGDQVVMSATAHGVVSVSHSVGDDDVSYSMCVTLVVQPTGGPRR